MFESMKRSVREWFRPTRTLLEKQPPIEIEFEMTDGTVVKPQLECFAVDCGREAEDARGLWEAGLGLSAIAQQLQAPPSMIHNYLFGEDWCDHPCPCRSRPDGCLVPIKEQKPLKDTPI